MSLKKIIINEDQYIKIRGLIKESLNEEESTEEILAKSNDYIKQMRANIEGEGIRSLNNNNEYYTVEQLSAMAFTIKFSLLGSKFNKWDENVVIEEFNGRGKVINTDKNLDIALDNGWQIRFNYEELKTKIPGTNKGDILLKVGKKYDVFLGGNFDENQLNPKDENTEKGEEPMKIPPLKGGSRNEMFRLLLNTYGKTKIKPVYGDGFNNPQDAKQYNQLNKTDKVKAKEFRDKNRDDVAMMISNLRKSFPGKFLEKLKKAFPEFKISGSKQVSESYLNEDEKIVSDKEKRWKIVFPNITTKTIDNLDRNIVYFMKALKQYASTPVGKGKVKSFYNIEYDEDMVIKYYNNYYKNKNESFYLNNKNQLIKEEEESEGKNRNRFVLDLERIITGEAFDNKKIKKYKENKETPITIQGEFNVDESKLNPNQKKLYDTIKNEIFNGNLDVQLSQSNENAFKVKVKGKDGVVMFSVEDDNKRKELVNRIKAGQKGNKSLSNITIEILPKAFGEQIAGFKGELSIR